MTEDVPNLKHTLVQASNAAKAAEEVQEMVQSMVSGIDKTFG